MGKTLVHIRALWLVLATGQGVPDAKQQASMSRKVVKIIAEMALPKRKNAPAREPSQPGQGYCNTYSGDTE
jgi:hypothetical protein